MRNNTIQVSCMKTAILLFLVIVLQVVVSACSVVDNKKSEPAPGPARAEKQSTSEAPEVVKSETANIEDQSKSGAPTEGTSAQQKQTSDVEVIEPKNIASGDIKLEPIPEPSPAVTDSEKPEAAGENPVATAESAKAGATVNMAKIEPAISKPQTQTPQPQTSPITKQPNHFVITVGKKDRRHPRFGEGNDMGFLINGVPGGTVVVERGKTYTFDVETNPKHDVYISKKPIGWGASAWSEGVEGAYIYQGAITFTPGNDAPDVLYYSCRNHPYMGGEIRIISPGEKIDIAKLTQSTGAAATAAQSGSSANKPQITVAMVNQKLMFAGMLVNSTNSARVKASANDEAKQMQAKAEKLVDSAKQKLKAGDNQAAYSHAEEALKLLKAAADLVPNEEQLAAAKESHQELLASIHNFELSHKENYERMLKAGGKGAAVDYDKKQVAAIKEEARVLAEKADYVNANKKLEVAQHIITTAIQQMLNSQTIVYDLNFATPKDEFEYELKRYGGYEELIPIAVEQKRPNEGMKKLMETYVKKGQGMRDTAVKTAKAGDYPRAIAMMQDATEEIRRALRMLGVSQ